jgi:hypothetical protein
MAKKQEPTRKYRNPPVKWPFSLEEVRPSFKKSIKKS